MCLLKHRARNIKYDTKLACMTATMNEGISPNKIILQYNNEYNI